MTRFHVNGKVVDTVDLLRQRGLVLRFGSWSLLLIDAIWMIFVLPYFKKFLSSFIIHGFLLAVFLLARWSVDFRCFLMYSKVKNIYHAHACKITPAKSCGSKQLVPLHFRKLADDSLTTEIYFNFRNQCFMYSNEKKNFCKIPNKSKETFGYYFKSTGHATETKVRVAAEKWGRNVFQYPTHTFPELMKEHCMQPLFVFQVLCVGLLCADRIWYSSMWILFGVFFTESMVVKRRLHILSVLRPVALDYQMLMVYHFGKWEKVAGRDLVPGDIVSLEEGKFVPADMLILAGAAIVNEAILTGHSIPQQKVSIMGRRPEEHLCCKRDKKHVLFGGTKILQHAPDMTCHMKTPDAGCLAIVLKTGFETTRGKMMRNILFTTQRITDNSWEIGLFLLSLVVIAIIAAGYVLKKGLEDPNTSRHKLLVRCCLIISCVIPLEFLVGRCAGVIESMNALRLHGIVCSNFFHIPFAGKVDICCFDKTGTLTSDDLKFSGVCGLSADEIALETDTKKLPTRTLQLLSSCHGLFFVGNKLVGNPLEKATIMGIGWSYKSDGKSMPDTGGGSTVEIVERHHFASDLKRMSVVVVTEEQSYYAFVKGAPETIKERLNSIPSFYVSTYKRYTRQGYRVLALAYKPLPDMTVSEARNLDREVVESGLTFAGFAVFNCPIRGDSATVLSELKRSSHGLVMITGDEALTACHVAREVNIISQPVLILVPSKNKQQYEWVSPDETEIVSYSEEMVEGLAEGHDLCIGGDCFEMLLQTCAFVKVIPYVKVFARVSPEQKELIITTFKSSGKITLMCGDGTNDIGALKQAHVGVALQSIRIVKPVDTSMASAFTAKYASISATADIIRQGCSTLVTTLQVLKILGLNCLLTTYVLSVMYLDGVNLGAFHDLFSSLFTLTAFMAIFGVRQLPTLSSQRAHPNNVLCLYVFLSILGQFIFHFLFLISSVKEAQKQMPGTRVHIHKPKDMLAGVRFIKPDSFEEFESNLVNTVSCIVSITIRVATFAVNCKNISENEPFKVTLLGAGVLLMVITSDVFRALNDSLCLVPLPMGLRDKLFIWAGFMFIVCYIWERFLRWAFSR